MIRHNSKLAYSSPLLFAAFTLVLCTIWSWPRRWLISGTPILQLLLHIGDAQNRRVLPFLHLWLLLLVLNSSYTVCATSWLLYGIFTAVCYAAIILVSLFQFDRASNIARRMLRRLLKQLHFIDDKIAFFEIPALEIDTDVDGLMVLRGITFSLSTLSFIVHGVEVGIKLSDDLELAIQTEEVHVKLFRSIDVGDCFANVKGLEHEMTFDQLESPATDAKGNAVFIENTPLLRAAAKEADQRSMDDGNDNNSNLLPVRPSLVKMTSRMTDGRPPEDGSAKESFEAMKKLSLDNNWASGKYQSILKYIRDTNAIQEAREFVKNNAELENENDIRAAICSHLQQTTSVPHPPRLSIKVTTLQNLMPPHVRRFMHRLPFLLRLLLQPLSYFHPVNISSITASASGKWVDHMLVENIFKDYAESSSDLRAIKTRIGHWLRHANFTAELGTITGLARVPLIPTYDITTELAVESVLAYRALPAEVSLHQVVSLGGADARFAIPSFLLPHHDHLLPPRPAMREKDNEELVSKAEEAERAVGSDPKEIQAQHALEQVRNDEANVKISVHARLPAVLDQSLLDFIAALAKASKIAEFEQLAEEEAEELAAGTEEEGEKEKRSIKEVTAAIKGKIKGSMKRTLVDNVVNDRWVAKIVGRITKKLEGAMGEAGYSGDIPVRLEAYRTGESEREGEKLLP